MQYIAKTRGEATISVEIENPDRTGLEKLVEVADVVFYSKSWAWVSPSATHTRRVEYELTPSAP